MLILRLLSPLQIELFIKTWSLTCQRAINNLFELLKEYFPADYLLEIVDI